MSQITLNQFFDIPRRPQAEKPVAELAIAIPTGKVFAQLPDYPAEKLQYLSQRAEKLQVLQDRLKDATTHQKRDRIIACIAGAIMVGLVAGIVLGAIFCPPVAMALGLTLFVLAFASSVVVQILAEKDHRTGYQMIRGADIFCVGIPRLMAHFLTRKKALQNKVSSVQTEMKTDLLEAGRYLQQHIPAIRAKLERDIQNAEAVLEQAKQLEIPANLTDLDRTLQDSRALLIELNEKGQPLVDRMIQAGINLAT